MSSVRKSLREAAEKGCTRTSEGVISCRQCFLWTALGRGRGTAKGLLFFFQTAVQHWVTSDGKRVEITSDWDLAFLYCLWNDWLIPLWFIDGFEKQFRFERPLWKIASQGCMRGMKPAAWMKTFNFFFLLTEDQHDIWSVLPALKASKPSALCYGRRAEVDWAVYTDSFLSSDQC